jgi:hypothetical protein
LSDNPGAGGLFWGSVNCWALAQVPIQQFFTVGACEVQEKLIIKRTNIAILDFFNTLIFISVYFIRYKYPSICLLCCFQIILQ